MKILYITLLYINVFGSQHNSSSDIDSEVNVTRSDEGEKENIPDQSIFGKLRDMGKQLLPKQNKTGEMVSRERRANRSKAFETVDKFNRESTVKNHEKVKEKMSLGRNINQHEFCLLLLIKFKYSLGISLKEASIHFFSNEELREAFDYFYPNLRLVKKEGSLSPRLKDEDELIQQSLQRKKSEKDIKLVMQIEDDEEVPVEKTEEEIEDEYHGKKINIRIWLRLLLIFQNKHFPVEGGLHQLDSTKCLNELLNEIFASIRNLPLIMAGPVLNPKMDEQIFTWEVFFKELLVDLNALLPKQRPTSLNTFFSIAENARIFDDQFQDYLKNKKEFAAKSEEMELHFVHLSDISTTFHYSVSLWSQVCDLLLEFNYMRYVETITADIPLSETESSEISQSRNFTLLPYERQTTIRAKNPKEAYAYLKTTSAVSFSKTLLEQIFPLPTKILSGYQKTRYLVGEVAGLQHVSPKKFAEMISSHQFAASLCSFIPMFLNFDVYLHFLHLYNNPDNPHAAEEMLVLGHIYASITHYTMLEEEREKLNTSDMDEFAKEDRKVFHEIFSYSCAPLYNQLRLFRKLYGPFHAAWDPSFENHYISTGTDLLDLEMKYRTNFVQVGATLKSGTMDMNIEKQKIVDHFRWTTIINIPDIFNKFLASDYYDHELDILFTDYIYDLSKYRIQAELTNIDLRLFQIKSIAKKIGDFFDRKELKKLADIAVEFFGGYFSLSSSNLDYYFSQCLHQAVLFNLLQYVDIHHISYVDYPEETRNSTTLPSLSLNGVYEYDKLNEFFIENSKIKEIPFDRIKRRFLKIDTTSKRIMLNKERMELEDSISLSSHPKVIASLISAEYINRVLLPLNEYYAIWENYTTLEAFAKLQILFKSVLGLVLSDSHLISLVQDSSLVPMNIFLKYRYIYFQDEEDEEGITNQDFFNEIEKEILFQDELSNLSKSSMEKQQKKQHYPNFQEFTSEQAKLSYTKEDNRRILSERVKLLGITKGESDQFVLKHRSMMYENEENLQKVTKWSSWTTLCINNIEKCVPRYIYHAIKYPIIHNFIDHFDTIASGEDNEQQKEDSTKLLTDFEKIYCHVKKLRDEKFGEVLDGGSRLLRPEEIEEIIKGLVNAKYLSTPELLKESLKDLKVYDELDVLYEEDPFWADVDQFLSYYYVVNYKCEADKNISEKNIYGNIAEDMPNGMSSFFPFNVKYWLELKQYRNCDKDDVTGLNVSGEVKNILAKTGGILFPRQEKLIKKDEGELQEIVKDDEFAPEEFTNNQCKDSHSIFMKKLYTFWVVASLQAKYRPLRMDVLNNVPSYAEYKKYAQKHVDYSEEKAHFTLYNLRRMNLKAKGMDFMIQFIASPPMLIGLRFSALYMAIYENWYGGDGGSLLNGKHELFKNSNFKTTHYNLDYVINLDSVRKVISAEDDALLMHIAGMFLFYQKE